MTPISGILADLEQCLPHAAALTAIPDTDGSHGRSGKPGSRPPWNPAAAAALYGALAQIADTVTGFRFHATGKSGPRPAPSATGTALRAIERLSHAVPHERVREAAHGLSRCVVVIRQLPARDEAEVWEKLRAGPDGARPVCPHCGTPNLRVAVRAGLVACVLPGCQDGHGNRPVASMSLGTVSGAPMVVGADGAVWAVAP